MNILFIIKGIFLWALNGHRDAPNIMLTIDPARVIMFKQVGQSHIRTHVRLLSIVGATPNHIPLKYRCRIKIRTKSRTSTLLQRESVKYQAPSNQIF